MRSTMPGHMWRLQGHRAPSAAGRPSLTLGATAGTTHVIVVDSLHNAGLRRYVLKINNW
ncbi:hypothetical protein [Persicimonas caeni]|uniref:hypothetical protein n=1 Tax=Persicimonas caeni TaxID=2292766 RepID=UPI00143D4E80|nr:hypothetical protein [Persicimonas caeni]